VTAKLRYLRRVFHWQSQLTQVTAEFLAPLVISLYGIGRKLTQFIGDALCLGHLTRSHSWTFLVEHVLELYREDLAVLVELLCACVLILRVNACKYIAYL
jgi:hypothetical protein